MHFTSPIVLNINLSFLLYFEYDKFDQKVLLDP